jgi:hypothetical protein
LTAIFTVVPSGGGTFGYTSIGANTIGTGVGAAKTGGYFHLAEAGAVTKITAYIYGPYGQGMAKCAIYSDSGGNPGLPIGGATRQVSVPASAAWVDFVYDVPVNLEAGYYWITLIDGSGANWFYDGGGTSAWNWVDYASEPVAPFGAHTDRTDQISIYATYTTG